MKHRERLLADYVRTGDKDLWTVLHSQETMLRDHSAHISVCTEDGGSGSEIVLSHTGSYLYAMKRGDGKENVLNFAAVVESVAG